MNKQKETYESYADQMKSEIKSMIDRIDTKNRIGVSGLKMTYGFVRRCMLNSKSSKTSNGN